MIQKILKYFGYEKVAKPVKQKKAKEADLGMCIRCKERPARWPKQGFSAFHITTEGYCNTCDDYRLGLD